ncbi:histone chaperone domain CHZ-domain-containing protein [Biscogniauxia mediterranea]|nr:histone chaperone domain CHZ-domain-containing protein [Biscogniauxia mediterranea]
MTTENSTTLPQDPTKVTDEQQAAEAKGKGKAVATEVPADQQMEEDDDDDDDDDEEEGDGEDEADDGMDEIDMNNIVEGGRRTRGRVIDWAKAAEENPAADDDDDDEDEFQPEGETEDDKMDED